MICLKFALALIFALVFGTDQGIVRIDRSCLWKLKSSAGKWNATWNENYVFSSENKQRRFELIHRPLEFGAYHTAIMVGDTTWEILGASKKETGAENVVVHTRNYRHHEKYAQFEKETIERQKYVHSGKVHGFTQKSDYEIVVWVAKWIKEHPKYNLCGRQTNYLNKCFEFVVDCGDFGSDDMCANCQDFAQSLINFLSPTKKGNRFRTQTERVCWGTVWAGGLILCAMGNPLGLPITAVGADKALFED